MHPHDDDLSTFEALGAMPLPPAASQGTVAHDGARIWYATYGSGTPVLLLHGGLGHSGNWGHQVPALTGAGYQVILIDSRGHGRSTRDTEPYRYERMAGDVLAVLDALKIPRVAVLGWSDGAIIAMILAIRTPKRISGVLFFGGNMDPTGLMQTPTANPVLDNCISRHATDYAMLSATPDGFRDFVAAVTLMMNTQPHYDASALSRVQVPVVILQSEKDEFIRREHAEYLARTIPGAELRMLPGVSHFAPLQRPQLFNDTMLDVLRKSPMGAGGALRPL